MSDIPNVIHTADLQLGGLRLRVHNLDNGQRVIDADDAAAFFLAMQDGTLFLSEEDNMKLAKAVMG